MDTPTRLHSTRPHGRPARSAALPRDPLAVLGCLTLRDRHLLDLLDEHQVLTTSQLTRLAFPSRTMAQRRLLRLTQLGVLDRFRWHQQVGSQDWHYTTGLLGCELIAAARGASAPRPGEHRRRLTRLAANPRLGHLLGSNDVFTRLAGHAATQPGCALSAWWSERRCAGRYGQLVRPDGYGAWTQHGQHTQFFFEYDTGTEPLTRVVAKLPGYADLARQLTAPEPSRPGLSTAGPAQGGWPPVPSTRSVPPAVPGSVCPSALDTAGQTNPPAGTNQQATGPDGRPDDEPDS